MTQETADVEINFQQNEGGKIPVLKTLKIQPTNFARVIFRSS